MDNPTKLQVTALAGGFAALLYAFYYVQHISFSIGIYYGISSVINTYNLTNATAAASLHSAVSQISSVILALHVAYAMIPFAIVVFAAASLWFFTNAQSRFNFALMIGCSVVYLVLVGILSVFNFRNLILTFPLPYIGASLTLAAGAYQYYRLESAPHPSRKPAARPISIDPDTPYSNIGMLSNRLMKKLTGDIRIIDMHFDVNGLDNLAKLVAGSMQQYSSISILTKPDRLSTEFWKSYTDFKNELKNRNVGFELRILVPEEAAKQHERLIMDGSLAYKIPPLNIINRKSEHIVSINHGEAEYRFRNLWSKATKPENMKDKQPPS